MLLANNVLYFNHPERVTPVSDDLFIDVVDVFGNWELKHSLVEEYFVRVDDVVRDLSDNPLNPDSTDRVFENYLGEQGSALGLRRLTDNGGSTRKHALTATSVAIDAGDASAVAEPAAGANVPQFDQRGPNYARIADIIFANSRDIDIGAFEFQGPCDAGADFDLDGDVDGDDFLAWQGGFGITIGADHSDGDADCDGDVDGDDFMIYQATSGTNYASIWILTDLDEDGDVDNDDADILVANIGQYNVGWSGGDVNEDVVVDMADFWLWYAQNGVNLDIAS